MYQVKLVEPAINRSSKIEEFLNDFLAKNDVDVVDIKYCMALCSDSGGREHARYSAMLIYKTRE